MTTFLIPYLYMLYFLLGNSSKIKTKARYSCQGCNSMVDHGTNQKTNKQTNKTPTLNKIKQIKQTNEKLALE